MFCNDRPEPEKLVLLRILLSFLPKDHVKWPRVERDYAAWKKGYKGEKEVDFYLRQLADTKYYILRGLRLILDGNVFQIDTLIMTTRFFLITEIKNYSGKIIYDTFLNQFIHIGTDGTSERMKNPLEQAKRQGLFLGKLLFKKGFANGPIETFFVNSNPSTILETIPVNPHPRPNMFNADTLVGQIHKLDSRYKKEIWSEADIKAIVKLLKKLHTPATYDLLNEYGIDYRDLIKGVPCPDCGFVPMKRGYGGWDCSRCGCHSKNAHENRILNYLALVKPYITNQECRELCGVDSPAAMNRMLKSMDLEEVGDNKSRRYYKK